MTAQKMSVGIVIPALNEGSNINNLLQNILNQKLDLKLDSILVISDGSTDNTVSEVKRIKNKIIKVVDHKERKGKSARMLEAFNKSNCDILILIDGDTVLEGIYCLRKLVRPIISLSATLVSGRPRKVKTQKLFDRIMDVSDFIQDSTKTSINDGDNIFGCHGRLVALHKSLYHKLPMPISSVGNDAFLYLYNKKQGGKFILSTESYAMYKAPQSFGDFVKQSSRFNTTIPELSEYFGTQILREYYIPFLVKLKITIVCIIRFHIFFVAYIACKAFALSNNAPAGEKWDVSETTKKL